MFTLEFTLGEATAYSFFNGSTPVKVGQRHGKVTFQGNFFSSGLRVVVVPGFGKTVWMDGHFSVLDSLFSS